MPQDEPDPRAILARLDLSDVTAVAPVAAATDAAVWRVEAGGQVYALRVFVPGREVDCAREVAAMRAAGDAGIPVPRVHGVATWDERPALLISWIRGRPLALEVFARPWRAWQLGVLFGRMQAAIHRIPAPELPGRSAGDWIRWAGPDERALRDRLRASSLRSDAFLHADYHPMNVMTDGAVVTGVLDWTSACPGDPRADAARTVAILRADLIDPRLTTLPERALRRVFEYGWRQGYTRTVGPLGDMALFLVWAGAMMERDLAPKRSPADLARIHRWTAYWRRRAGGV